MPFGVSWKRVLPFSGNRCVFPSADSMYRASINRWQTLRAISFNIEKVVVVVVVTMRLGSFGSGMRLDCENLREPRFLMASSGKKEWLTLGDQNRDRELVELVSSFRLTMRVVNRSSKSRVNGRSLDVIRSNREEV